MFITVDRNRHEQDTNWLSYIGGKPMLPQSVQLPQFSVDGKPMTFFFQIQMPRGRAFENKIISVFCQTTYMDGNTYIPRLPKFGTNSNLSREFFANYYSFFNIYVFDPRQCEIRREYNDIITYSQIEFKSNAGDDECIGRINERPEWILDDECPSLFEGDAHRIHFLFQLREGLHFAKLPGVARQTSVDPSDGVTLAPSMWDHYELFCANELYFFGINYDSVNRILVIPQS